MSEHSILPPSSAHIWGARNGCTGWVKMNQLYPETERRPEAMEGDAAHEVCHNLITQSSEPFEVGQTASNGVVITQEMLEGAEMYADAAFRSEDEIAPETGIVSEQKIDISSIHPENFGTPDDYMYSGQKRVLVVGDFKFGYEPVEVYENWQMIDYAAGLLDMLGIDGDLDQRTTVVFRIIQPRAYHPDGPIREWRVTASELRGHFNILSNNAHKALSDKAEFNTGPHCKHCPGRHACAPALAAGARLFEATGAAMPIELDNHALGVQYSLVKRALAHLESLESGLSEEVNARIRGGASVSGWGVQPYTGAPKWSKDDDEVIAMGDLMGVDLRKPEAPKTPTQVKALGIDPSVIEAYSTKPTGVKLAPININKAKQVFT